MMADLTRKKVFLLDMDGTLDFLHYIKEIGGRVLTIFVLSGEGTKEDMNRYGISPDFIYDSVKDLYIELAGRSRING